MTLSVCILQITLDEEDWNYQRFLTHLKFFVRRVASGKYYEDCPDDELYEELKKRYPQVSNCVEIICDYILIEYTSVDGHRKYNLLLRYKLFLSWPRDLRRSGRTDHNQNQADLLQYEVYTR